MNIIQKNYTWSGYLSKRPETNYIILHHAASSKCSPDDIHKIHLGNGWAGIGYHFYVRKDGSVYTGRPIDMLGAHTNNYNSQAIGICFEGNFEKEEMTDTQIKSGQEIITYLKSIYPKAEVKKHKDFNATVCPGKNFEFDIISKGVVSPIQSNELTSINDIVWELNHRGIITDKELWLKKLAEDDNAYWLARKTANMTVNK